ncbi:21320_t:CDS:2 [Dentiscutata erythropus]|uniref:21320_t:CDS:1 n=1 Tax=Dentiscutata erythropus TaxID=1348616 RepID=A0A9N9NIM5_9GLOM|nr:21320_t:CDS:2 [Dentiscutata erythropus]
MKRCRLDTRSASKKVQNHNKNQQAASSIASSTTKKPRKSNQKQLNDNTQLPDKSSLRHNQNEPLSKRNDNYESDHVNTHATSPLRSPKNDVIITSLASSPNHRSDDDILPLSVSSPARETDNVITPLQISPIDNMPPNRPSQFQIVKNEFEIALWLAYYKRILDLAINIRNGMVTRVENEEPDEPPTSTLTHEPVSRLPEINQHIKFQLQEECKALFLRTRNNSFVLYEEIVTQVCKIAKTDERLGSLIRDVGGWYNMYRYKFHSSVVKLAHEFKSIYESVDEPYDELEEFVNDDVCKQTLNMHLKATDLTKLKKGSPIFTKLVLFVHEVIKAVLVAKKKK